LLLQLQTPIQFYLISSHVMIVYNKVKLYSVKKPNKTSETAIAVTKRKKIF